MRNNLQHRERGPAHPWTPRECEAWAPQPPWNVAQWAARRLYFGSETGTAMPGYYRADLTPHVKEPMRYWTERGVGQITLCWGTQLGKTTFLQVCMGYGIDYDPGTMMLVMTSQDVANDTMMVRVWPLIRGCPALRAKFPAEHKWKASRTQFDGGFIRTAGSNSAGNLASFPVRYLFLDETAKYPVNLKGEGDAQASAEERQKAQPLSKEIDCSTPVMEGDNILNSLGYSLRHDRYVPCPHCGAFQLLIWERMHWPHTSSGGSADLDVVEKHTWYECSDCGGKIEERHKRWMTRHGRWLHAGKRLEMIEPHAGKRPAPSTPAPDDGEGPLMEGHVFPLKLPGGPIKHYIVRGEDRSASHVGFHLNSLHSLFFTWGRAAKQFLKAKADPTRLQVFVNAVLAEAWRQTTDSISTDAMMEHIDRDLPPRVIPDGYDYLFLGADYHGAAIGVRYVLIAVRHDYSITIIDQGQMDALASFAHILTGSYRRQGDNLIMTPDFTLVDSGWETQEVYEFTRRQPNCLPCKGLGREPFAVRDIFDKGKPGGAKVLLTQLFTLNPDCWKDLIIESIKWQWLDKSQPPPPGYVRLHRDCGEEMIRAFAAEKRQTRTDTAGRKIHEWVVVKAADVHYWDCLVYAVAASRWRIPHIQAAVRRQQQQAAVQIGSKKNPDAWRPKRF